MSLTILDRYLLGKFWRMFAGILLACAVLIVLVQALESFQKIAENGTPLPTVILFFLYFLPFKIVQILPLISILAILFSVGILAHNREMIAITAAGLSPLRVAAPLMASGVVISLFTLVAGETIVPYTETRARDIRKRDIEGKVTREMNKNIFVKGEGRTFYAMSEYRTRDGMMVAPTFIEFDDETGRVRSHLAATTGVLLAATTGPLELTEWRLDHAVRYEFNERGRLVSVQRHSEPLVLDLEKNLHKYLSNLRNPEEMSLSELRGYIQMLAAHNEPSGVYQTDLWLKLFFPFASLIFVVSGFAFAMRAQVGSMVVGFSLGILYAVGFYVVIAVCQAMGHRGVFPPMLSALAPIAIFAVVSYHTLRRSAYTLT